ncbi:MAG TPA: aspartate racemase [Janthinobacterium sp.]|nr:aspartate racemase [Janthinobacterium sp.]
MHKKIELGMVSGLGRDASADIAAKLDALDAASRPGGTAVVERRPADGWPDGGAPAPAPSQTRADPNARKLHCFDLIRAFEQRALTGALLPCFISHTFIDELQAETTLPILNMMHALSEYLERHLPPPAAIGVLTSDYVRRNGLFERCLGARGYRLLYPDDAAVQAGVMEAVYGPRGIKRGGRLGEPLEQVAGACENLLRQGAQLCLPGITEIPLLAEPLLARGIALLDTNQIYAQYAHCALAGAAPAPARHFKIGVIGGVGPAATVDFMEKIIRNTPASRDQDHIKLVVEHNPQIPDRTANLIGAGADPTLALYAAAKRLQADDADIIAIPCNTAHAFVERIQPALSIPIVHMLNETVAYLRSHCAGKRRIGLLATSGTLASRVYHEAVAGDDLRLLLPDPAHQALVMRAIYGEAGVKAGFRAGQCRADLLRAMEHLARRGAEVIILACTELPLLVAQDEHCTIAGRAVAVLDPGEILARRCVALAQASAGA